MTKTIDKLTKDLIYISETDEPIIPFTLDRADAVTAVEVLRQIGHSDGEPVETETHSNIRRHWNTNRRKIGADSGKIRVKPDRLGTAVSAGRRAAGRLRGAAGHRPGAA